ncbi:MAG TPA: VacJ family lipoprotein [Gammaproteobacteria bacterium]|nr:VacJ family lipoprotein [Gammaproteobacteria bacterium]
MAWGSSRKTGNGLRLCALAGAIALAGCAVRPPYEPANDPLEPVNRAVYKFNDTVDRALIKPVAQGYKKAVPQPVRTGVGNFFDNLKAPVVVVNDLLQGKVAQGGMDTSRFIWNSTVGLAGLIDVATPMGLEQHDEDFGQTFGAWGIGEGWYLVLPLLGPSTVRDAAGLPPAWVMDPVYRTSDMALRNGAVVLRTVNTRARLLGASNVLQTAALDPYLYTREAYRQYRWNRIYDGNPPPPPPPGDEDPEAGNAGPPPADQPAGAGQ